MQIPICEPVSARLGRSDLTPANIRTAMQIPPKIRLRVMALTLYDWNVPLSRLGQWLGVSKSTVVTWVTGLAVALYPTIRNWIVANVTAASVAVDEKWLKIRHAWHSWCVGLDEATGLPVVMTRLPALRRNAFPRTITSIVRGGNENERSPSGVQKPTRFFLDFLASSHIVQAMSQTIPCSPNIQGILEHLPFQPGVYLMKDAGEQILYVGKAKLLRNRVRSYFRLSGLPSTRIASMVAQIANIEYIVTASELEALILEATLIKKHKPPYNIILKDDKNFPYLKLTVNETFPRLETVRKIKKDGALYFGPYVHGGALQKTLKLIMRLFPLRLCSGDVSRNQRERPCFEHEIHRCPGVCAGKCSPEEYARVVEEVKLFLQGKKEDLINDLRQRMAQYAEALQFEQAARLRDQIDAVTHIMERQQIVSLNFENQDVIATARNATHVHLQIFFIRNGMLMGRQSFQFSEQVQGHNDDGRTETLDEREVLRAFVEQYYLKDVLIPEEILLPQLIPNQAMIAEWLTDRKGKKVAFVIPQRGRKRKLIEMAQQNAALALQESDETDTALYEPLLEEIKQTLHLTHIPHRIECFDISNLQGTLAVGSMVVCEFGRMQPKAYKRFRIKTIEGSDDFGMINEVITRRYARLKEEQQPFPDLIIVDGGKGQLHAAQQALYELHVLHTVDLVGLAKAHGVRGSDTDQERIFAETAPEGIVLDTTRKSAQLLQHIRDEAHRFAITYHRSLRKKANFHSILEEIPGVGQKRRKRLLTHFGSLKKLKDASREEIAAAPSITHDLAETIYTFLHSDHQENENYASA